MDYDVRQTSRTLKHRIDHLKCLIDLLTHLRPCQDNLATDEYQEHDLRLDHTVDETGKQLRLV